MIVGQVVQSDGARGSSYTGASSSDGSELSIVGVPVINEDKQGLIYRPGVDEHVPG